MDLALSHSSPTSTLPQPAHQTRPKSRGGPPQLDEKPSMGLSIRRHAPSRQVVAPQSSMCSPPWVLSTHHFSEALHGPINTPQRVAPRWEAVTSIAHSRSPPWTGQPPRAVAWIKMAILSSLTTVREVLHGIFSGKKGELLIFGKKVDLTPRTPPLNKRP